MATIREGSNFSVPVSGSIISNGSEFVTTVRYVVSQNGVLSIDHTALINGVQSGGVQSHNVSLPLR